MNVADELMRLYDEGLMKAGEDDDPVRVALGNVLDRHEQMVRRQAIRDLHAGRITAEEVAAAGCETRHVIDLRDDGWTVKHPLTCRADLFACPVNVAAGRDLTRPPDELGQYACSLDDDGHFAISDKITAGDSDA